MADVAAAVGVSKMTVSRALKRTGRSERSGSDTLRQRILIPTGVADNSLRTDGPFAYRDFDECLALINEYVEPVTRFSVIGYMGHL